VKISVKTAYACRVLAQIARLHGTGELAHVEALAKLEAVPPNYLAQILSELRDGGLITSRRGKTGGYALARSPEDISLFDIVTLVEGDVLEFGSDAKGWIDSDSILPTRLKFHSGWRMAACRIASTSNQKSSDPA